MEENKIDKIIRDSLKDRRIETSPSAWERLENSLNESQEKENKKSYKLFISVAASILLLLSVFLFQNTKKTDEPIIEEVIVETPNVKDLPQEDLLQEEVIKELPKEVQRLATKERVNKIKEKVEPIKDSKISIKSNENIFKDKNIIVADTKTTKVFQKDVPRKEQKEQKRIRINSNDLLYAVTHSDEEVKAYYAKLKLSREDVLDTIKKELKLSNLKVNPETILVEVERTIEDEEFNGNFMQKLKLKISDIAVAIADRNK